MEFLTVDRLSTTELKLDAMLVEFVLDATGFGRHWQAPRSAELLPWGLASVVAKWPSGQSPRELLLPQRPGPLPR
jgi:hypothetical protein